MAAAKTTTALAKPLGASMQIQSVAELEALALILYKGGLTPPGIDKPEKVAAVILAGMEVGLSPTQALGSIMLTNGRLSIYGDGALALVRASWLLESIAEIVTGEGDDRHGTCEVKRKNEPARTFTFSMREAKQAKLIERAAGKGPWATYPDRMLLMRARGFAIRDVFPDVLRGLVTYEEASDTPITVEVLAVNGVPVAGHKPSAVATVPQVAEQPTRQPDAPKALPASPPVASAPETPLEQYVDTMLAPDEPVTAAQKEEFFQIRQAVMTAKNLSDKNAQKAEWEQTLAPFGFASVGQMTRGTAAKVLADLGPKHLPFPAPAGSTSKT